MFVFIFQDRSVSLVHDNITVADLMAVSLGVLTILKVRDDKVEVAVPCDKGLQWIQPPSASVLSVGDVRFHNKSCS